MQNRMNIDEQSQDANLLDVYLNPHLIVSNKS